MTQHFRTLIRAVETTSQLMEIARSSQTYRYTVGANATVYLHIMHADVYIARHDQATVEIVAKLGAPFAWRIAAEQDDLGVYFVAHRRPVVGQLAGALANALYMLTLPHDAHIVLRLEQVRVSLTGLTGDYVVLPQDAAPTPLLRAGKT
jgi:hypothetical protein